MRRLQQSREGAFWKAPNKRDCAGKPMPPSQADLEALHGIGPVIARRIIEGRPYRSVEELDRVKGIGKKRLEEIRPLVTAE